MNIKIDWLAYFKEFSRAHGGYPVVYMANKESSRSGFLLFRDGWMYSRQGPAGPEVPPANDEDCRTKIRDYWTTRQRILEFQFDDLKQRVKALATAQDLRSAPIMVTESIVEEDEAGNRTIKTQSLPVDFNVLVGQAKDYFYEIKECERELQNIRVPVPVAKDKVSAAVYAELDVLE